jgi:alpha-glucosidase
VERPWWKEAVFYQIYPRSFADSNGDGVGDLEGIRRRLDHLSWLGVDAIWVCPFYPSPMADFGYDVADYCDVDPRFGTLADFDRLLSDAHERGIRVIIDWVPNHTSDRHPWFVESRSSRDNPKRDWYVWRDTRPDGSKPNNWRAAFGGDAWTFDETTGQWYLHLFLPEQPDVNWRDPGLVAAMHGVLRFWLDRGVDGFRIDVVHGLGKDPELGDDPPDTVLPRSSYNDHPDVHPILRDLRRLVDAYPQAPVMVGEVYLLDTRQVVRYLGEGDELHLAFDFTSLYAPWDAVTWRATLERVAEQLGPVGGWPTWTLSNHDNIRHRTRYDGPVGDDRARAAAVMLLTLRGTPFLYQGEELGLADAEVPPERVVDPGGRDPCRAPLPWDPSPEHGWGVRDAWLPWPPEPDVRNAETLRADPASILHLYGRLLTARRASEALRWGELRLLDVPAPLLAYERCEGDDRRVAVVNFGSEAVDCGLALDGEWIVDVASDATGEGAPFSGRLAGDAAVLLKPA